MPHSLLHWQKQALLHYINSVETAEQLAASDDGVEDPGHGLGKPMADKIIAARALIPGRRFSNVEQMLDIPGFGLDKLESLVAAVARTADEGFEAGLRDGLLGDNWEVEAVKRLFPDDATFHHVIDNPFNFRRVVIELLYGEYPELHWHRNEQWHQILLIERAFIESFEDGHMGSFALAFWFYHFAQDNWFDFGDMRKVCESYLTHYGPALEDQLQLRLIKGFNNPNMTRLNAEDILPVVVNPVERGITVWKVQLSD